MSTSHTRPNPPSQEIDRVNRREHAVWPILAMALALLAVGAAVFHFRIVQEHGWSAVALPVAGVLIASAGIYAWKKKLEADELRRSIQGFRQIRDLSPSHAQLEKLAEVIATSRQGYRDLIDSFDHLIFTLSLEGEIRTVNQRIAQVL